MLYKNIEIHNAAEIFDAENGASSWLRVPQSVYDGLETEQAKNMCKGSTGVELRFTMNSPEVKIKIRSLGTDNCPCRYQVFYGGIQGGWESCSIDTYIGPKAREITIKKPKNTEMLERMNKQAGHGWDVNLVRVIFTGGVYEIYDVSGDVEPPKKSQLPEKTLLAYGSSITHGTGALATPNMWTFTLAHNLGTDLINLGMAGSCRMEPAMVEYIAKEGEAGNWDLATLELGINALDFDDKKIYERVTNTIRQIAGRNPDKKVFVISPFYSFDDFNGEGKSENWRKIMHEICSNLSFDNVMYIDGKEILGDMSFISADEVHPNVFGVHKIAYGLTDIIKRNI